MPHIILIKTVGVLFVLAGMLHWLIILGLMEEVTPVFLTLYFHSLAVLSPITGIGLWMRKDWGRQLGQMIAVTQIPAHLYMIYLDNVAGWSSGLSVEGRIADIALAIAYLLYFRKSTVKAFFDSTSNESPASS